MSAQTTIYLDNAATSWPKPTEVVDALIDFYRNVGVAAGRGTSGRSAQVDRMIDTCRHELARLINAKSGHIIFCFNGTDGLNLAIAGMLRDGDHVVATDIEHNSVLRPVSEYSNRGTISFDIVKSNAGVVEAHAVAPAVTTTTRLVCVSHVSNVTGIEQDIAAIASAVRAVNSEAFLLVDAAQSVGHIPVDVESLGCDILVASGHKGLLGPLGTGFVYLSDRVAEVIRASRFGGTGSNSESIEQPMAMPYRLEAGNLNVGGIAGLLAGIRFITNQGIDKIAAVEHQLVEKLIRSLDDLELVQLYGADHSARTGVVSFNIEGQDPQSIAALLDNEFGIQLRAGYHCAPLMHEALGTNAIGGTLRASPGIFNTESDIEKLIAAVAELASQLV